MWPPTHLTTLAAAHDGAARHVDLSAFDPGRMAPFDPAGLRRG